MRRPPPRLLVLGNACWDVPLRLPRLPAPGETLLGEALPETPGGKGLNQAVVAARAGARVRLVAPLGDDARGAAIRRALAREGPGLEFRPPPPSAAPTDLSVLAVAPDGENAVLSANACADGVGAGEARRAARWLRRRDAVLLQGGLGAGATLAAAREARRRGARVWLNAAPARGPAWLAPLLPLLDLVVVNAGEAAAATGRPGPAEAALALRRAGARRVAVTIGARGCLWLGPRGRPRAVPARRALARDTTGAGDVFCGALAAALLAGRARPVSAAARAAAWAVARPGCFGAFPPRRALRGTVAPARPSA